MKQTYPIIIVLTGLLAALAFAADEPGSEAGLADAEVSLRKGSVFETLTPPAVPSNESVPGEVRPPQRPNVEAPAVIPHGIGDFLPITAESNLCVDCHAIEVKVEGEPTPIPASHYVDLRNTPDKRGSEVAGARYLCLSCHVEQTGTKPLVGNSAAPPEGE